MKITGILGLISLSDDVIGQSFSAHLHNHCQSHHQGVKYANKGVRVRPY
jgi:hypothetical protein